VRSPRSHHHRILLASRDGPSGPEAAKAAVAALQEATAEVMRGNPATTESALAAQAEALDVIFREYARIAALNTDICSVQTYMRFALKAQTQCRVTIETWNGQEPRAQRPSPNPPRTSSLALARRRI